MPAETVYADLVLAVAALIAGALYLRTRRRRGKRKKVGPPIRPATPTPAAAGPSAPGGATWAPPPGATPAAPVAPTIVAPPAQSPSWDRPGANAPAPAWSGGVQAPAWSGSGNPGSPAA